MRILKFENIKQAFTTKELYYNVSGEIYDGNKIGLIGQNGSGKSTLVKALLKEFKPDSGSIVYDSEDIGYVPQEIKQIDLYRSMNIVDAAMMFNPKVSSHYARFQEADTEYKIMKNHEKYMIALTKFQDAGGYEYISEISTVLNKAGLNNHEQKFYELSEGQKRLVYLSGILASNPALLVLDEPTNHVDHELKESYIRVLKGYKGAVLAVSHDRELLREVCNEIWEMEDGILHKYKGNWEVYEVEHRKYLLNAVRDYQKNSSKLDEYKVRLKDLQLKAKLTKDPKYKSKITYVKKQIERIESSQPAIKPTLEKAKISGDLSYLGKSSEFMVRAENLEVMLKDKLISTNLTVGRGEKVALVGKNGSGKSTVLKVLLGICDYAEIYSGTVKMSPSANIGYFNQTLRFDDENETLYRYIERNFDSAKARVYGLMKRYLFDKTDENKLLKNLSGGEKNRAQMMGLIEGNYNFLILDEPTNHLDLYQVEALEEMLKKYNGAILLISHDKIFRQRVVDREVEIV